MGKFDCFCNYALFVREFQKVSDHSIKGGEATSRLFSLRHGQRSVADYSIDFHVVAVGSGGNDTSLKGAFYQGLNETIKDELVAREEAEPLDALISLATKLHSRLREHGLLDPPVVGPSLWTPEQVSVILPPLLFHLRLCAKGSLSPCS